jgi:hypothetical protein
MCQLQIFSVAALKQAIAIYSEEHDCAKQGRWV